MLLIFNLLQSGYYTTEPVASRYEPATIGKVGMRIVIRRTTYSVQGRRQPDPSK